MLSEAYIRAETDAEFIETSVGDFLRDAAQQVPDRIALINHAADARQWTYRELLDDAEQVARALLARFSPGDRVAAWAAGSVDYVRLQLGAALANVALVTINPASRAGELQYMMVQSRARGLFLDASFRGLDNLAALDSVRSELTELDVVVRMDEWDAFVAGGKSSAAILPPVSPDSPTLILFTSGTTGKPKAVVLRHAGIVNNARLTTARIAMAPGSVWLNVLPMFHVGGTVTMTLGCLANLGTQVFLPAFTPDAMLDALQRHRVTMTMAVPTMLHAMFQHERFATTDFSALKVIVVGGTAIAPELVREVKKQFGLEEVMVLFGQTEAGGAMCVTRRGDDIDRITQSVGTPLPLSEGKIAGADGKGVAKIGEIGEICIRTRCVMSEYFGMPEKTRETIDAEGWLHTGDLGTMRPDGYIQITGRLKDMIIRGGENIYPREVEDFLAEHPAVSQAAVFGIPDPKWGEQVAVAVIARPGHDIDSAALVTFLEARIARHKIPKFWHVVDSFPVNASGKIQKFMLREQYGAPGA